MSESSGQVTAAELLRRAAYRIAQPGAWCQHYGAIFADGTWRYFYFPTMHGIEPTATCAYGAMWLEQYLAFGGGKSGLCELMEQSFRLIAPGGAEWNDADGRIQVEVVYALLRASEVAESKEAVPLEECCV